MTELYVDGNNLTLRSFYAPKTAMTSHGHDTGTLTLFINTLAKYVRHVSPTHIVVAFDGGYSAWRKSIDVDYKADRKKRHGDELSPPFALLKEFLSLAGVNHLELPGYEGDDVIAAMRRASGKSRRSVILSGDKDLLQLIDDSTCQYRFVPKGKLDKWDKVRVKEEFGVLPKDFPLYLALVGDKSDGVVGLPGVGPRTAVKILKEADYDLERVKHKLAKFTEQIERNLLLVDLKMVPLDLPACSEFHPTQPGNSKWNELMRFCDTYELENLKSRLANEEVWGEFLLQF